MIDLGEINYLAVLVATVVTMILGFLWYSPILLGNAWMKQRGMKMEDMSGGGPATYILTTITALIGVFIVALIASMVDDVTVGTGAMIGLLVGLSVSAKIGMNYLFENGTKGLYFITIGYHLVSYLVTGVIIGAWSA